MKNQSKYTAFGLKVKVSLLQQGKNQLWLEEQITKKTGLFMDGSYLYKILTGQRDAPKVVKAISEILSL